MARLRYTCLMAKCALLLLMALDLTASVFAQAPRPTRLAEADAIAALKSELQKETSEDRFSGAILVAKNEKPIFEASSGYADRDKKIRNTTDTKFRFGSMGKMFTAVAVLELVEAGRIRLDDPISKYLPDYPNKDVAAVTIQQLLTHTGGTGDIFTPEYSERRNEMKELSDYVALYGNRGPEFAPGSKWEYSNYGFLLLGRIIEVASGQSYYDYVRDHIFEPAGMDSTGNLPEDQHVRDLSIGYTKDSGPHLTLIGPGPGPGGPPHLVLKGPEPDPGNQSANGSFRSTEETLPYRGTSAGGGYSTVGDLLKFVHALSSNKLLNAHDTKLLITGKVDTPRPGTRYAYGFEDHSTPDGVPFYGHGGGSPGMNGRLSVFPRSGYIVIVLSNFDPPAADDMARFISDRLPAD
ncbi:MAG TPA: serine hydrolase domain-containing protein [Pseudacidobacterium sp.]|nr:serine hydrolase domain-containing protein [Pseudacidobacterium sp.]